MLCTCRRVSFDKEDAQNVKIGPKEEALIGKEWLALQTAWRAAERRYASVLKDIKRGRQVPDMNGCYEIQNLRWVRKDCAFLRALARQHQSRAHV